MQDDIAKSAAIPKSILWLLALWVVVILFALVWGIGNAETTLLQHSRVSLAEAGYDVAVDVSGRDARLIGSVVSEDLASEIVESIDAVPGVRAVVSDLAIVEPPPAVVRDPEVSVRVIGDAVSLRGAVPNIDVETELNEAAEAQFGTGRVVNGLTVSEGVEMPPWMGRIRDVFPHIGDLRSGGFTATDEGFDITGVVISEAVRTRMLQEIELVLDAALPVTSDLTIAVLPSPTFSAAGSTGVVTLDGVVPSQETYDQIAEAAQRLHEGKTIVNALDVGEVAGSMWLEIIDGLLDIVTRLDPWTIDIADGEVTITGLALDSDLAGAVDVLAREVVAGQLEVATNVQVNPAAVALRLTNLLEGSTTFASNGSELSPEGIEQLDSAVAVLEENQGAVVIVVGYTDNEGDPDANLLLSQERAEAVVAYLIAGGIDADRLSAVGYGAEDPIGDNSTPEGRAQNRRIEFVIQEGDG